MPRYEFGQFFRVNHTVNNVECFLTAVDPECNDTDLRFMPGEHELSGVVQVCFSGMWGFVCDGDEWDKDDAVVACRQLGLLLLS